MRNNKKEVVADKEDSHKVVRQREQITEQEDRHRRHTRAHTDEHIPNNTHTDQHRSNMEHKQNPTHPTHIQTWYAK